MQKKKNDPEKKIIIDKCFCELEKYQNCLELDKIKKQIEEMKKKYVY